MERTSATLQPEAPAVASGVQALLDAHRDARAGRGGALCIVHSRYGGGTELVLRELRRALLVERESVFEGSCRPDGATYRPLREMVSRWVRVLEDVGELDDELLRLLAEVGPSLGLPTSGQPISPLPPASGGPGQLRFFEALGRLLRELAARHPAVLIVHDVHLSDSATLAVLRFLFESVFTDPVGQFAPPGLRGARFGGLVVATAGEHGPVFQGIHDALAHRADCQFVSLRDVEEEQVRRFVTADEVVEHLILASAGSVDNLRELFGAMPRRIEDLYERRLQRLHRGEHRVLEALAVLGRPVKPDFLLRVADTGTDAPSLAVLSDQRMLVRQVSRGEMLVDFPSADNRRLVYESIPDDRRRMLHGRVAALLEERSRLGEPVDIETIAHHYLASNVDEKAVSYAIEAAERLHISWAWQRAREVLLEALPRVRDDEVRLQVLERLLELEAALGQHDEAIATAAALLQGIPDPRRAAVLRKRGEIRLEKGEYEAAAADAIAAITSLPDIPGDERLVEQLRVAALHAEALYGRGLYEDAVRVAQEARQDGGDRLSPETARELLRLTNTIGKVSLFLGRYEAALADFEQNRLLAQREGLPQEEVRALFNQGTIALQRRRYDEAERIFGMCRDFGAEIANPVTRSFLELNLGVIYHKTLRYGDALSAYLASLAMFRQSGNDLQYAVTAMNLGSLYETLGDFDRARALLDNAVTVCEQRDIRYFLGRALYVLGTLELLQERWSAAQRTLDRAAEVLGRTGSTFAGRIRIALARAAHGLGERDVRDRWLAEPLEASDGIEGAELRAEHALYVGIFALDAADVERAVGSLRASLHEFEQNEHHERVWLVRGWLGLALLAAGEPRGALEQLREAVAGIDRIAQAVPATMRETYRNSPERKRFRDALEALAAGRAPTGNVAAIEVRNTAEHRRWRARYAAIVGDDPRLLQLLRVVDRISDSTSTVLIQGESGTGKELVAEAIHRQSSRANGPFVKVNCAAFVETLLLSELFGHEKGAFTGALARKKGRFELADGGTLFLDEIGDVSPNTQVALLRVLQERSFERVGGGETVATDVRLICATNRNLEEMVRAGTFRLDLYYRLKGVVTELPPLRERRGDIPLLIEHFCRQLARDGGRPRRFSRDALVWLVRYSWPGNIRELENFVRSMILFVDDERVELANVMQFEDFFADGSFVDTVPPDVVAVVDGIARGEPHRTASGEPTVALRETSPLPTRGAAEVRAAEPPRSPADVPARIAELALASGMGLHEVKDRLEVEMIRRALVDAGGNIAQAARILDMKRPRLSQIVNGTPELEVLRQRLAGDGATESFDAPDGHC